MIISLRSETFFFLLSRLVDTFTLTSHDMFTTGNRWESPVAPQPATAALYGLVLFPRGPGTGIELLAATTEMLVGRSERSTFLIGSMYLVKL